MTRGYVNKIASGLLALLLTASCLFGCGNPTPEESKESSEAVQAEYADIAGKLKLAENSSSKKAAVTVRSFIDGDTTHFNIDDPDFPDRVLKARYLAINTPESTGKIEEYGKAAANFTHDKLAGASSILVESDDESWNKDSTGSRILVWVWYRTSENEPYRNLNIEILQNGLAIASSAANNRYGSYATEALNQAKSLKLNVFSGQKDPLFYYGDAVELTLAELRMHTEEYNGIKVAFEGVVTRGYDNSVYVEEFDPDTERCYGMVIYIGFNLSGQGQAIMRVGNRVRVVGTVSYWEGGGTYQVSGLSYRAVKPDDPSNIQKLGEGFEPAYVPFTAEQFNDPEYMALALDTTVSLTGLYVSGAKVTADESSDEYGAMTLICTDENGQTVQLRTAPLHAEDGSLITPGMLMGKTLVARGVVSYYGGIYQLKLFSFRDITILE